MDEKLRMLLEYAGHSVLEIDLTVPFANGDRRILLKEKLEDGNTKGYTFLFSEFDTVEEDHVKEYIERHWKLITEGFYDKRIDVVDIEE